VFGAVVLPSQTQVWGGRMQWANESKASSNAR